MHDRAGRDRSTSAAGHQAEKRPSAGSLPQSAVLHVPFTYFPDAVGGTEIHVAALIAALRAHGIDGAVAAPGDRDLAYLHDGVPVYRLAIDPRPDLAQAYGAPDRRVTHSFAILLARLRPRIVHLHARSAAVSEALTDAARTAGAKIVLTCHTPTVGCVRGTMMRMGRSPCNGKLDRRRCSACVLAAHGMPPLLRNVAARMPEAIGRSAHRAGLTGRAATVLRLPGLIGAAHGGFHELMCKADRVVAVCDWGFEMLRLNGITDEKLVLCRQGLPRSGTWPAMHRPAMHDLAARDGAASGILRLGYFGRLDPVKGIDILIDALRRIPDAPVRLDIFAVRQTGFESYASRVERHADGDRRIVFRAVLPPEGVSAAMRRCDIVAVPSRCLETGPLVVLEAFDAGTPVLGARLGGIAELVADRIDGVLVPPEEPALWAAAIRDLATRPAEIARLRAGIRPPRTIEAVADEMAEIYRSLAVS